MKLQSTALGALAANDLPLPRKESPDDGLLAKVRGANDQEAAALLRRRYGHTVFRIVRFTLGPRNDMGRLAQEIFTRAVQKVRTGAGSVSAKNVVLAATIGVCQREDAQRTDRVGREWYGRTDESAVAGVLRQTLPALRPAMILDLIEVLEEET